MLRPHLRSVAAPPASVDWYSRVTAWPMYANGPDPSNPPDVPDGCGDCTEANVGHTIQGASTYGDGSTVTITVNDVLAAYSRVTGYDATQTRPDGSNPTDRGAMLQDVYNDWRKVGVGGHKALAFAEVNVRDLDEVKTAIDEFGAVGLGIDVSQRMMDDVDAGEPWARVGGGDLGGHAVPAVGYDARYVYVVTWAQVQKMTWDCFKACVAEGWVAILPEWVDDTSGKSPLGLDLQGLGEALAQLTGSNPFPVPEPDPTPTPTPPGPDPVPPQPGPSVDEADRTLAHYAHRFIRHRLSAGEIRSALYDWVTYRGL